MLSTSGGGPCVDILAPGDFITVASTADVSAYSYLSGTSAATPFVAGAAALFLSRFPMASPALVQHALVLAAGLGTGKRYNLSGTVDRMVS